MKQIHTITAILNAIKEFGSAKFSIYDVTTNIRDHMNDGDYELSKIYVTHGEVKECFQELWDNGIIDALTVTYNRDGYREYQWVDAYTNDATPTPQADPVVKVVQTAMATTNIPTDVQLKIYSYLKNNGPATMKQIQSRLKGYSYTCKDIKEFLEAINLIDPQSTPFSTSQQYTVSI